MQFLYQLVFYILLSVSLSSHSSQLDNTFHQNILTKEEQAYLKKHPVIKVQCISDSAPYNFVENGKPQGFSIDHIQLLASKINLKVEIVTGYTWNQYLELLKEKKIDVMLNIVKNKEREKFYIYTPVLFYRKYNVYKKRFSIR
jgi:ABC-type amino acid transport substrate-binding protein